MSRRRKKQGKTFQQRQSARRQHERQEKLELDAVVEDMAARFTCSTTTARDFADQCMDQLDDLGYDLDRTRVALDFWAEAPPKAAPVLAALRDLLAEHERHEDVLAELHQRLVELSQSETVHHHLDGSDEHFQNQLRLKLFPDPDPRPVQNHAVSDDH